MEFLCKYGASRTIHMYKLAKDKNSVTEGKEGKEEGTQGGREGESISE